MASSEGVGEDVRGGEDAVRSRCAMPDADAPARWPHTY